MNQGQVGTLHMTKSTFDHMLVPSLKINSKSHQAKNSKIKRVLETPFRPCNQYQKKGIKNSQIWIFPWVNPKSKRSILPQLQFARYLLMVLLFKVTGSFLRSHDQNLNYFRQIMFQIFPWVITKFMFGSSSYCFREKRIVSQNDWHNCQNSTFFKVTLPQIIDCLFIIKN